jgi:hypothetical protein
MQICGGYTVKRMKRRIFRRRRRRRRPATTMRCLCLLPPAP